MIPIRRLFFAVAPVLLVILGLTVLPMTASTAVSSRPHVASNTITMELPKAFNPVAPKGGHDLYHCALLNPNVTTDQMITSIDFVPGNAREDHHAILYWIPPSLAAAAQTMNNNGKGWTCFGGPGVGGGSSIADLGATAWLGGWSPGHGATNEPAGTGMPLPAGSLIVMQIHYNLLEGHWPDQSKVTLTTVPTASANLIPLHIDLYPAPMDLPCPAGKHGTLCNRAASLKDIGKRFGASAITFDNLLEDVCHGGVPVVGDTAYCTWGVGKSAYIWYITPHMHLLGVSFKVTLITNSAAPRVLLNVPSYDFHYQRSYDMAKPVLVVPGDSLKVSCTYNPVLRSTTPYLKSLPPRFVLWADGSSDEMCLGIVAVSTVLPAGVTASTAQEVPTPPSWPAALAVAATKSSAAFLGTMDYTPTRNEYVRQGILERVEASFPTCI